MKIKPTFNKENISDVLELSGRTFTVNGKSFDLDNLKSAPEAATNEEGIVTNQAEINQFNIDNPVRLENGEAVCYLSVAMNRNFLFMNNNYLIFHDKNMNRDFDQAELEDFIKCYNLENEDRIVEHRLYYVEFCLQSVSEGNKNKAREFYNLRSPGTLIASYTRTLKQFIADEKIDDSNFKAEVMTGYNAWMNRVKTCMEMK